MAKPSDGLIIRDCFFLPLDVCIVMGDIPYFVEMIEGLIILNNTIQLCWTSTTPAHGTSMEKMTLTII